MPELPEVETTKISLTPFLNKRVKNIRNFRANLRWDIPNDLARLQGYTLTHVSRRAKYLILHFTARDVQGSTAHKNSPSNTQQTSDKKLIIHLGMSGSLQQRQLVDTSDLATIEDGSISTETIGSSTINKFKHDHVVFTFEDMNVSLNYHDPRRFGAVLWYDEYADKLFEHLAPEPLSEEFNAKYLYERLKKTQRSIKASIMDQTFVVGVGNIYATESLFLSGIHPLYPSNKVTKDKLETLVAHIKTILQKAITLGGSSLNDFSVANEQTGYFQQTLLMYGRAGELCGECGSEICNVKITGRASAYCPTCQYLPKKVQPKTR